MGFIPQREETCDTLQVIGARMDARGIERKYRLSESEIAKLQEPLTDPSTGKVKETEQQIELAKTYLKSQ